MDIGEPVGQTTYDADFKDMDAVAEGVEHVKKSADITLEGLMDIGEPVGQTEYAAKFHMQEMLEKVVDAHKAAKASLEGVFNYGDKSPMCTEYDASFVANAAAAATTPGPETTAGDVDTAAAQQDEGSAASASMEPTSVAPAESEAPAAKSEPVMVMDGGDSAADSILISHAILDINPVRINSIIRKVI